MLTTKPRVDIQCPVCLAWRNVARSAIHSPQFKTEGKLRCRKCTYIPGSGVNAKNVVRPKQTRLHDDARTFVMAELKDPPQPTSALPGTPEKIEVMRARHLAGQHIHHPKDLTVRLSGVELAMWVAAMGRIQRGNPESEPDEMCA